MKTLLLLLALSTGAFAAGNDRMTLLNGTLPLSRYSIPGTHDSGARFEPLSGTAKCQNLTIAAQLAAGVRFPDIRCRRQNNAFPIHRGPVYQNINFTDVLNDTLGFLNAGPYIRENGVAGVPAMECIQPQMNGMNADGRTKMGPHDGYPVRHMAAGRAFSLGSASILFILERKLRVES